MTAMTPTLKTHDESVVSNRRMNKELFGVFGTRSEFECHRSADDFDEILTGESITVGVRDPGLGVPSRSASYSDSRGLCLLWGEIYPHTQETTSSPDNIARWLFDRYAEHGRDALSDINGSYLAVIEHGEDAFVSTDPIRSWECFYTDAGGQRLFTTDFSLLADRVDTFDYCRSSLLEYIHLGTVLGERTLIAGIDRIPFDGYLTADSVGSLSRFVYNPQPFDYVEELTERLIRAVDRRSTLPGPKGVLLSGGHDSRIFLAEIPDIDQCYTIGNSNSREVTVARKLAAQYDIPHTVLKPDKRYLMPTDGKSRYSQGIKEALHIHQAGFDDAVEMQTVYHGTLFDTLLKGYFLERDGFELFGTKLPSSELAPNPDPIKSLLNTLGFFPDESQAVEEAVSGLFDVDLSLDSPYEFLFDQLHAELSTCWERTDSVHNAMDLLIIKNQPVLPTHAHLADNYFEAFVAVDSELLEWHLMTPPKYRRYETFRKAVERIDEDILKHRPQSQPLSSVRLNQIQRFLRRKLPFLDSFEPAWPDRDDVYKQYKMDEELFPEEYAVRQLPARLKLRVYDARWWRDDPQAD
ncbi:hypothetical protein EIK79_08190 [Halocatena pleomorpha]|uniref:Uncharacterized protein n=2 Tax=Halocatena pleomorpha TaxID=1785090 RepID=A0A3P3RBX4_9EURY|nr:hypothetical protein EIK79_08190 [Halocatena pleomorpha]